MDQVTGQLKRIEELKKLASCLEAGHRDVDNFAHIASHDLQEPIRKIILMGDRLRDLTPDMDDQAKDLVVRMQKSAGRMKGLIDDLAEFSSLATADDQEMNRVNLKSIILKVLDDLAPCIHACGARVATRFKNYGEKHFQVAAREGHVYKLFLHLISNALKFHKKNEPPDVEIGVAFKENGLDISVSDKGIGFDEKYLDRIFKPFKRLHGQCEFQGNGMGLTICHRIVTSMGGTLTAKSRLGKGTTFLVWLPAENNR